MNKLFVGIDPDIEKSGVCIIKNNEVNVYSYKFTSITYSLLPKLKQINSEGIYEVIIFVEAGWLIKHIYEKFSSFSKQLIGNIGMKIGNNHGVGKNIVECAKYYNLNVEEVLPLKKTNNGKISHIKIIEVLKNKHFIPRFTSTNQDERDAIMITLNNIEKITL